MELTFFILGLVLAIPVGILTNLATPKIQILFENRSLSLRGKKLKTILAEYKYIKNLRESPPTLSLFVFRGLATGLSSLTFLVFLIGLNLLFYSLSNLSLWWHYLSFSAVIVSVFICTISTMKWFDSVIKDLNRVMYFDKYKNEVVIQVQRLGGNTENL